MADKLRENEVLKQNEIKKLKHENDILKKKLERCNIDNKKWTKNEQEWIKIKMAKNSEIEELKKKDEEKRCLFDELKKRHEAEKKAIVALKKSKDESDYEKVKNELGTLNKKYADAVNEIKKLARLVNTYGKNLVSNVHSLYIVLMLHRLCRILCLQAIYFISDLVS